MSSWQMLLVVIEVVLEDNPPHDPDEINRLLRAAVGTLNRI